MKIEIDLDEILKAVALIENEWGEGSWAKDLPEMHQTKKDFAARYEQIEQDASNGNYGIWK